MANASKRKGDAWEVACVKALKEAGFSQVSRLRQNGRKDVGDLGGLEWFGLECKDDNSLSAVKMVEQADREAVHAMKPFGVVLRKSPRRPADEMVVMMSFATFVRLNKYMEDSRPKGR